MADKIINTLSIIIPVYNEERTIKTIINKIQDLSLIFWIHKEIIIINDGSHDKTQTILDTFKDEKNINIIHLKENYWKWNAIIKWLEIASWEYTIIQDADLEYNPIDINNMLSELINKKVNILYWSRNLRPNKYSNIVFYLWWKLITMITNIIYKQHLTDEATWYKLIKTNLLKSIQLESKWFDFCIEVTAKMSKLWYKIWEIPISYSSRWFKEGKKMRIKDGIITFYKIFKYYLWKK